MTPQLPPLTPFSQLLLTALGLASRRVDEGSRLNARQQITAREEESGVAADVLGALAPPPPRHRRSA
jgi:hypothetical protein